jgi:hypothetical protein
VPCCDRRIDVADVEGLSQITACCRCRLLYALELYPDRDGGCLAVLTVLVRDLVVAQHRGGRQVITPDQPLITALAGLDEEW